MRSYYREVHETHRLVSLIDSYQNNTGRKVETAVGPIANIEKSKVIWPVKIAE